MRFVVIVAGASIMVMATARTGGYPVTPQRNSHVGQAVEHVRQHRQATEPVLVHGNNASAILRC